MTHQDTPGGRWEWSSRAGGLSFKRAVARRIAPGECKVAGPSGQARGWLPVYPDDMSRTYILTERQASECLLSVDDVEFLFAEHARHLRIVPTRQANLFRLTPTRLVGTILAPSCRLVILPKMLVRSFATLLDIEADPDEFSGVADGRQ